MLEDITESVRKVIKQANNKAHTLYAKEIHPLHVLWGIVEDRESFAMDILKGLGLSHDRIQKEFRSHFIPKKKRSLPRELKNSLEVERIYERAKEETKQRGNKIIGTEDLLIG